MTILLFFAIVATVPEKDRIEQSPGRILFVTTIPMKNIFNLGQRMMSLNDWNQIADISNKFRYTDTSNF